MNFKLRHYPFDSALPVPAAGRQRTMATLRELAAEWRRFDLSKSKDPRDHAVLGDTLNSCSNALAYFGTGVSKP